MFSIVILTAFVLRIYYFDYTVNARPNVLHGTFRFFPNTLYGKVPNTRASLRETGDRRRGEGGWDMGAVSGRVGRDDPDERQISHQRTCLLLPSASTLRRTPWTGSCAPEPAGVIIHDTRALGLSLQSGSTRANCRDVEDRTLVQPTQSQHLPLR